MGIPGLPEYNKHLVRIRTIPYRALIGFSADRRRYDRTHTEYANIVNEELLVTFPAYITAANSYSDATSNTGANFFTRWNYSYKGRYILPVFTGEMHHQDLDRIKMG
jgi:hypothetical protein